MKNKKKFLISTLLSFFLLLLMSISICSASIEVTEIGIGGIPYHASADYIKSIYGEPDNVTTTHNHALWSGKIDNYYYGDSFQIVLRNDQVIWLGSTANNGLATPAGIKVGMKASMLTDVYATGAPRRDRYGNIISYYYRSIQNEYLGLKFDVDAKGIIKGIYAGQFD